ncbi:hypothetical protein TNCV_831192 [Trichonephila clavipes]|nr:hypothetical protein TNCV_831192 [Trichonephila clavipes]
MLCMVVFFEKLEEFRIICLQATCDGHRLRIGFSLPPYTIITHSVKRRQSVEPVCANGHRQGLLLSRRPGPQDVLRRPWSPVTVENNGAISGMYKWILD